ncbi:outer membrane protein [Novipirellula artificiosorum]|uniref:Surface antigen n=1 Tax=Novipirellula artificiosorum TaxID=2528016 RepID=A0A5C6DEC5_9BACT|nr:outer membrane beta-barrel protein [Novipirellula artificiosorum]TWU33279.1 Surface antigen [Novipirellula artificiosorum]
MRKVNFFMTALVAVSLSPAVQAAGPFGLFDHGGCDSACEVECGCEAIGCDSNCDVACDSVCCGSQSSCGYVSLFGGWNFLHDYTGESGNFDIIGGFSDGWAIGGALGRRIGNGFRAELEFAFRSNTADTFVAPRGRVAGEWSGHSFAYSGMGNVYYDVCDLQVAGITPYIGGGIGLAVVDADFESLGLPIEIQDAAFAYQAIVGATKQLNRSVDLFAEYRYVGTTDITAEPQGFEPVDASTELENVFFGIRLNR